MLNFWTYVAKVHSTQIIMWEEERKKLLVNAPKMDLPAVINSMESGFQFVHWIQDDMLHGARYIPPGSGYPLDGRQIEFANRDWEESENHAEAVLHATIGVIP
jgi:hypothetical protein